MIFISHTSTDRPFAAAIEKAIRGLSGSESLVNVNYSSSSEAGPQGGEKWREWIDQQIIEARLAIVLVSPSAIGKTWLLWEAGACHGAKLMADQAAGAPPGHSQSYPARRRIVSVAFGLTVTDCPDPLRAAEILTGTDPVQMTRLLDEVIDTELPDLTKAELRKIEERKGDVLRQYVDDVHLALLKMPCQTSEANIQDWLSRLTEWVNGQRSSELSGFERWMASAFGREGDAEGVPIDVRLHRRLGELYLKRRDIARSERQLELARRAAPRDIYVLRPLGEAYIRHYFSQEEAEERTNLIQKIQSLLDIVEDIDPLAFSSTPDVAALRAKYERRVLGNVEKAIEICRTALRHNPDSYYLADVLGQTLLQCGRREEAEEAYRTALSILDRLKETNVWTCATYATSYLVLGNRRRAIDSLNQLADLTEPPASGELEAVAEGLRDVLGQVNVTAEDAVALLSLVPGN